jgi:hypothetical protein
LGGALGELVDKQVISESQLLAFAGFYGDTPLLSITATAGVGNGPALVSGAWVIKLPQNSFGDNLGVEGTFGRKRVAVSFDQPNLFIPASPANDNTVWLEWDNSRAGFAVYDAPAAGNRLQYSQPVAATSFNLIAAELSDRFSSDNVAGQTFDLRIRILPENDPRNLYQPSVASAPAGDPRLNEQTNRFVAVSFVGEEPVQGGLVVTSPSLDCPPDLYVYRLDFGDGLNISDTTTLRLNDLVSLLGDSLGDSPLLDVLGSVTEGYEAEFSYSFGLNGGLVAGYDSRTSELADLFYIDTRGVLPYASWVERNPTDLWGFNTAPAGYDPVFAEALLRLDAGLDRLQRPDRFKLSSADLPTTWVSESAGVLSFSLAALAGPGAEANPLAELEVFKDDVGPDLSRCGSSLWGPAPICSNATRVAAGRGSARR